MGITVMKTKKEDFDEVVDAEGSALEETEAVDGAEGVLVDHPAPDEDDINGNVTNTTGSDAGSGEREYQFDFFVIGGGSGGVASALQAAKYAHVRVGLCDFVTPTPSGTSWGLGGTCVNVGCIPKKLMHQAALLGESLEDAPHFGWDLSDTASAEIGHDWNKFVGRIKEHIQSLNWGYRVALQKAGVEYFNALAQFVDDHTLSLVNKNGEEVTRVTAKYFLIAVGGRPRYLDGVPGAEWGGHCITSDDIFYLPHNPGKVVVIGASYIALETAGFLSGLGNDVTILVRSQLLRGFDQQMAEKVGQALESHGVQILRDTVPTRVELLRERVMVVHGENVKTEEKVQEPCNTVILAVGRSPSTANLRLEKCGIKVNETSGKIMVDAQDQTSVEHCFALGDVAEGRPELTPVAIRAGVLLAKRLFGGSSTFMEYDKIPTTVFTPLEYGCVGLSEEKAIATYGPEDIEVFHTTNQPLEFTLPGRDKTSCYSKLICVKSMGLRVVGFHYLGPHAGEVTQGFALGIKMNATKEDIDGTIGIHPTCAEQFTTMTVTKSSGDSWIKSAC